MKVQYLFIISCLMTTSASAAVVVKGVDTLSDQDKEKVFGTFIQRKHDVENAQRINADLAAALPGKKLNAYWVPDTLYQVVQTYFDLDGLDGQGGYWAKQARHSPDLWKKTKKMGAAFNKMALKPNKFRYYLHPITLAEHKAVSPSVVEHWARFNRIANEKLEEANFLSQGSEYAFSKILKTLTYGLQYMEKRHWSSKLDVIAKAYREKINHLKDNASFLKHALKVEEQAHREGKLLLWRYTQPLANEIPDLPFNIKGNSIEQTLRSLLQYYKTLNYGNNSQKFSYAARLLDGYFGDGAIYGTPMGRIGAPACTFSFMATDTAAKKNGYQIPDSIVYSLALSPQKIKELNDKLYLYHTREAMPQHQGIYGIEEGFHPSWFLGDQSKENVKAWLELMKSDALQVHLAQGKIQDNFKNNPEAVRGSEVFIIAF